MAGAGRSAGRGEATGLLLATGSAGAERCGCRLSGFTTLPRVGIGTGASRTGCIDFLPMVLGTLMLSGSSGGARTGLIFERGATAVFGSAHTAWSLIGFLALGGTGAAQVTLNVRK